VIFFLDVGSLSAFYELNKRSIVRYTFAIRQAPHPLLSFCSVMGQN